MLFERSAQLLSFGLRSSRLGRHDHIEAFDQTQVQTERFPHVPFDPVPVHSAARYLARDRDAEPGLTHVTRRGRGKPAVAVTQRGAQYRCELSRAAQPARCRQPTFGHLFQALRRTRPLARRARNMARPARVLIRARKPCVRLRLRTLG